MASDTNLTAIRATAPADTGEKTVFKILLTISFCHLLNDTLQSLIPAIYPLLKNSFHLDFGQVGLIALTLQLTASVLQPLVGLYTDRRPQPYSLAVGMGISLAGLLALALAPTYATVLTAAAARLAAIPPPHAHATLPTGRIALSRAMRVPLRFSKSF